jgi:hypothetical protein
MCSSGKLLLVWLVVVVVVLEVLNFLKGIIVMGMKWNGMEWKIKCVRDEMMC